MFTGDTAVDGFIICKKKNVYKNVYKTAGKGSTKISQFVPPVEGQKKQESQLRLEATKVKS